MPKIVLTALGIQVNMYFFSRISAKYATKKQETRKIKMIPIKKIDWRGIKYLSNTKDIINA